MYTKPTKLSLGRVINYDGTLDVQAVQLILDGIIATLNQHTGSILSPIRLLENVVITEGLVTKVKHGLDREINGYIVVKSTASILVYDVDNTNTRKKTELWLTADNDTVNPDTTATVSLLVF